jgi:GrpB-like predicted nucleotidyltransferase (UPF0157 family)
VSIPIDSFGSDFRIGPLTGPASRVRVQVLHLAAGGAIGRHPTGVQQLFAVVAGDADVSGADGKVRRLGPGYAALWVPGEEHDARSDEGCTAVCVEGSFEMLATSRTQDIVVDDYDERWPAWFAEIAAVVWPAVEDIALRVDHVGSTSVPGLAAKPIIDLDIVVRDESDVRPVIDRLRDIGYRWRGDLGVVGRQAFFQPDSPIRHHLYLVVDGSTAHLDHVLLRDLLRADPAARAAYGALKRANAAVVDRDIELYGERKQDLIAELLARARAERGLT